jgi:squalene-hopene/tetraprenyl-beta-curcumene cyclase
MSVETCHPPRTNHGSPARRAAESSRRYLLDQQAPDGHWCAELEGDTILESEYVLTLHFLGRADTPKGAKAAEYLRRQQLPTGGWAIYPGGRAEVSASVKAYLVLKLVGDDPRAPHMARAREVIRSLGGVDACNSFTRIYLAVLGQYPWERCPAVPPELVLLPPWAPFSLYRMSYWSRAIVVPLSIIWAQRPFCPVPPHADIEELRAPLVAADPDRSLRERAWRRVFTAIDRGLKLAEGLSLTPLRAQALAAAERWILERLPGSDGLGAIFPPIVNTILAFKCLGYGPDDPRVIGQLHELEKLAIEDDETLRLQPCFSAVWDTALSLRTLADASADHEPLLAAVRWLLEREVHRGGDWRLRGPQVEPSGWYFEYANQFYPDTDDTAEVLGALAGVRFPDPVEESRRQEAIRRGLAWHLAMQNEDGGWGAFDKGCDLEVLTFIPFADHNAMIDPSWEDITGRSLEAFGALGITKDHPAVGRAISYLRRRQASDGTWYGRWGCNYLYGTYLALTGLQAVGENMADEAYQRSARWLEARQNEDGGWGELPASYDDPRLKGCGPSTPSQTAWALLGLMATGRIDSPAVTRGLAYLIERQRDDGSWKDEFWTGTGFPKVFYLRYHLYATYFPLRALALYDRLARRLDARPQPPQAESLALS